MTTTRSRSDESSASQRKPNVAASRDLTGATRLASTIGNAGLAGLLRSPSSQRPDGSRADLDESVARAIQQRRGSGAPLSGGVRGQMEQAFGEDFSRVRVHTDAKAHQLNESVQARAFTVGDDIFLGNGSQNHSTRAGKQLLAHELAHVMQQSHADSRAATTVSRPADFSERDADTIAQQVTETGASARRPALLDAASVQLSRAAGSKLDEFSHAPRVPAVGPATKAVQLGSTVPVATTRGGRTWFAPGLAGDPLELRVRAHEAVHRAQGQAWRLGAAAGSVAKLEKEAVFGANRLLAGERFAPVMGAPLGVALNWDPDSEASGPAPSSPTTSGVLTGERELAACESEGDIWASSASPPISSGAPALTSEPEAAVCEPPVGASFDPDAVDVTGVRNDDLNAESLRVDRWIAANAYVSPPHPDRQAYLHFQGRLNTERTRRVQGGHLWLTTATPTSPSELLMLLPEGGATNILSVDLGLALGTPNQSFPGPIMTRQQFEDHMAGLGVPIMTEQEYYDRLRETAGEVAPELLASSSTPHEAGLVGQGDRFRGYLGGIPQLDTRARLLQQTLPYRNVNVRAGDIAEAFFHPGILGGTDYNAGRGVWSGDPLRPRRRTRGAVPVADLRLFGSGAFRDVSVKTVRPGTESAESPSVRRRYKNILEGHADILNVEAPKFQHFATRYRPGMPLEQVSAGMALAIPEDHVDAYRDAVRDATGFDRTEGGNPSTRPKHGLAEFRRIYESTPLPEPIDLQDGELPLRSGADVYEAKESGRITQTQFDEFINRVGAAAADRVISVPMRTGAISWYEDYLRSLPPGTRARDRRAAFNIDTVQVLEQARSRQQRHDPEARFDPSGLTAANRRVSLRNARRGAGAQVAFTAAGDLLFNENADLSDPHYRAQIAEMMAVEGLASFGSEFGESYLRTRVGLSAAQEGLEATAPRVIAGRVGARALPGVADMAIEGYGMWTDERENSMEEIVTRTGRAAVIGTGAAWAGAAAGTAIGGPLGFVVGFGVGASVGWLANKIIPGGAEDWERRAEQEQRVAQIERRVAEIERLIAAREARERRLNTPLSGESASVAGVEGMFGLPTTNPMFLASEPGVEPTVGDLETAYLVSVLEGAAEMSSQ